MTAQVASIQEALKKDHVAFQEILSDDELAALFAKHGVQDERQRKLFVRCFFWLMVFSAGEPSRRGSLLQLIGFFWEPLRYCFPEQR
jgi:hypothetical protein